jgi:hypothetical protein
MPEPIPIALFAYNRPDLLERTLAGLRANEVPLLYAFSDGPRLAEHVAGVEEVRRILRAVDWCQPVLVEREQNLGLGLSIRSGVQAVLQRHQALIVCEDDLLCVPGTYRYLCAALHHYRQQPRVMSVTAWTHPRVAPPGIGDRFYFDGRAECLLWGTWRRAWVGMDQEAATLIQACRRRGVEIYRYGADVPAMAEVEQQRNIWAVRWLLLHMLNRGLCLRPPRSLVEHIGFDARATNAPDGSFWANPPLAPAPALPERWPDPEEHPACAELWRLACGSRPRSPLVSLPERAVRRLVRLVRSVVQA